jgi:hypothetical protein
MEIRRASESEAGELSALAIAAKAHWGYASELLREWRSELSITRQQVRSRPTFVLMAQGSLAGFYSLEPADQAGSSGIFGCDRNPWGVESARASCATHCKRHAPAALAT